MEHKVSFIRYLKAFGESAGLKIDSIKINAISEKQIDGHSMIVKRRHAGCKPITVVANLFFHLAHAHISVWTNVRKWQQWETDCFLLLNGDRYNAWMDESLAVLAEKVPGVNLRELVDHGQLTDHMLQVAARELRRTHNLWCNLMHGTWSHGDMQMSNIIYDEATDTARIIDFETMHDSLMPTNERRADDLLVFLQDMMWRVSAKQWVHFSTVFLSAYDRPDVLIELKKRLTIPHGIAALWWRIRANRFIRSELIARANQLKRAIGPVQSSGYRMQETSNVPTRNATSNGLTPTMNAETE